MYLALVPSPLRREEWRTLRINRKHDFVAARSDGLDLLLVDAPVLKMLKTDGQHGLIESFHYQCATLASCEVGDCLRAERQHLLAWLVALLAPVSQQEPD